MLSAARQVKLFSLGGILRQYTLTTNSLQHVIVERTLNEPHESRLNPDTVSQDTKGEGVYDITVFIIYSTKYLVSDWPMANA